MVGRMSIEDFEDCWFMLGAVQKAEERRTEATKNGPHGTSLQEQATVADKLDVTEDPYANYATMSPQEQQDFAAQWYERYYNQQT